jgi:hypothetical protein
MRSAASTAAMPPALDNASASLAMVATAQPTVTPLPTATPLPATPTPRPTAAATATPRPFSKTIDTANLHVSFTADPAVAGATSHFTVAVTGPKGAPVDKAEVKFWLTAQALDLGTQVLTTKAVAPGRYVVAAPAFATAGNWQVQLVIRRDGMPDEAISFALPVAAPAISRGSTA